MGEKLEAIRSDMKNEAKTKQLKQDIKVFTPEEIFYALQGITDLMEGAMLKYMLVGDIAREIKDGLWPIGAKIELVVKKREFSKYTLDTLRMLQPDLVEEGNTLRFTMRGVPVEMKIIHRNYSFLVNPDFVHIHTETFSIPNPFEKYWSMRALV